MSVAEADAEGSRKALTSAKRQVHHRTPRELHVEQTCNIFHILHWILYSLGAEGVLPGRYIESLLRVFK